MNGAESWLLISMVGASAAMVLGACYVLAVRVRDECELHDLIVKAQRLRLEQARKMAMLGQGPDIEFGPGEIGSDVEIMDEPVAARAA